MRPVLFAAGLSFSLLSPVVSATAQDAGQAPQAYPQTDLECPLVVTFAGDNGALSSHGGDAPWRGEGLTLGNRSASIEREPTGDILICNYSSGYVLKVRAPSSGRCQVATSFQGFRCNKDTQFSRFG